MTRPNPRAARRVVLVVLDGLRPDAIPRFGLRHIASLSRSGASTMRARTVSPSVTACAMASLLTGVTPAEHGLRGARFHLPRPTVGIEPLPRALAARGYSTSAFLAAMPLAYLFLARRIASRLEVATSRYQGADSTGILKAARSTLATQREGLILMHWPDGDRAGHESGWMSRPYENAVRRMDDAVGELVGGIGVLDAGTLLVLVADHGGGGATINHHDSTHPLDTTIPIILAAESIRPQEIPPGASILDVPATICGFLGVPLPRSFGGSPLAAVMPCGGEQAA